MFQVNGQEDKKRRSMYHLLCNALCQEYDCSTTARLHWKTNTRTKWLRCKKNVYVMLQWNTTSWKTNDWKELHCQEPTPPIHWYPTKTHWSLKHWIYEASNKKCWNQLIDCLTHPATLKLHFQHNQKNGEWDPRPSTFMASSTCQHHQQIWIQQLWQWRWTRQQSRQCWKWRIALPPWQPPPRNQPQPQPAPPSQPAKRIYDPILWLNNPELCEMIGRSIGASWQILHLGLGASEIEAKMKYGQDKINPAIKGLTAEEASEFFKLLNNAKNTSRKDFDWIWIGNWNWKWKLINYYIPVLPGWSTHASSASTRMTCHEWFHNDELAQRILDPMTFEYFFSNRNHSTHWAFMAAYE